MAIVRTRTGELAGIRRTPAAPSTKIRYDDGSSADFAAIYCTQPNVRTVVDFLARNIASIGLHAYRRGDDDTRERIRSGPLGAILDRPWPRVTQYRWIDALIHDRCVFDRYCAVKMRPDDGAAPAGLLRIPPSLVTLDGGSWVAAERIKVKGDRGEVLFPLDDVLWLHGYNPTDGRDGLSPMQTLRQILDEDRASHGYRKQMWHNGARMGGVIERPKDAGRWGDTARSRFREDFQRLYAGDGAYAGGTPVLEEGMTFKQLAFDARSSQYIEARKLTREEVAAAFHIPPPMVGLLDNATFSNITEQHKMLYVDTLGPWLTETEQDFALQLLPDLIPGDELPGTYVEFNVAAKMRGSFEEQAAVLQTSVGAPWMTRNEARSRVNLPAVEGGDELVTPLNVTEGGQASPTDSAPKALPGRPVLRVPAIRGKADGDEVPDELVVPPIEPGETETEYAARLAEYFEQQAAAVEAPPTDGAWDTILTLALAALFVATAAAVGQRVVDALGDHVDPDQSWGDWRMTAYLNSKAESWARAINDVTRAELDAAADDVDDPEAAAAEVWRRAREDRAPAAARDLTTEVTNFAAADTAGYVSEGSASKRWIHRPGEDGSARSAHAAMNGETVPVAETFSNGLRWPGDRQGGAENNAGCRCGIELTRPAAADGEGE